MKKIIVLKSEIEALRMKDLLDANEIPFVIRPFRDPIYHSIFQFQNGWGRLDAEEIYEEQILKLYNQTDSLEKASYQGIGEESYQSNKSFLYLILIGILIVLALLASTV